MFLLPVVPFAFGIALAASLVAAVTDVWIYKIYNALTWPLLVLGLIYHSVAVGGIGLVPSVLGACLGFVPMAVLYLSGGLGAGDVKLMAGLGAWLGPLATVQVLYVSWLAAGVYAIGVLLFNALAHKSGRVRYGLPVLAPHGADGQISQMIEQPNRRRRLIPFGVMILAGVVVTWISSGLNL